ncbi:hypothetical protein [Rhodoferax sp. GW822-FHT02A01]|uniref:DUF6950 family protein n=1 Tax=Rhodoferax sp. GW822-FHT02A01 TaxID=3141537 RepID=UPI00315CD5E7
MTLQRNTDEWWAALDSYVQSRQDTPFAWGVQDCCTFAADWVTLATGTDPMQDLRGLDSALAAHRKLDDLGGMLAAVDSRMGDHIAGPMAQAGDVVMVTLESGVKAMALCLGAWLCIPAENGLVMLPITNAEAAWRV